MPQVLSISTFAPRACAAAAMRRDVLHLEGVAAGAFRITHGGVGPHQRFDAGLVDHRIVEGRLNPEALSMPSEKLRAGP